MRVSFLAGLPPPPPTGTSDNGLSLFSILDGIREGLKDAVGWGRLT
jgi:hypothetical protein